MNGYEIINKIEAADEVEIMEFDFSECFAMLHEYEELKKNICIYARERMSGYDFNSDKDVIGYFEEHAEKFKDE